MKKFLFIKIDKKFIKINCADIHYIEAVKNYVRIITCSKNYILLASMHHVEELLPDEEFCRIHRSFIISLEHIASFDANFVYLDDKKIPISRQYKNVIQEHIVVLTGSVLKHKKHDRGDNGLIAM
jgi:two-component system response regulator LytT